MDRYFAAKNRALAGERTSYLQDIYGNYANAPPRKSELYEKALAFRNRELEQHSAVKMERDSYMQKAEKLESDIKRLRAYSHGQSVKYSKLRLEYERAINDRDRGGGSASVPVVQSNDGEGSGAEQPNGVSGEVLQPVLPVGGQAGEHAAEGRHEGGSELQGSAEVPSQPVQ